VIRAESVPKASVHVSGSLDGPFLTWVFEHLGNSEAALGLSEVSQADAAAARILARLDGRYRLVNCPSWLVLWIERERQPLPARSFWVALRRSPRWIAGPEESRLSA
jgi:hypothetical protein